MQTSTCFVVCRWYCLLSLFLLQFWILPPVSCVSSFRLPKNVTLPKSLSDHSATLVNDSVVLIVGGCDSELGNEFVPEFGWFTCFSITNSVYAIDLSTQSMERFPDLPQPRYRHAAAAVVNDNETTLWIVGGRNLTDGFVTTVDVLNVNRRTWTTYTDLPTKYYTSDHTSFSYGTRAYFVGGYNVSYEIRGELFSIDTVATQSTSSLVVNEHRPLLYPRGDVQSAVMTVARKNDQATLSQQQQQSPPNRTLWVVSGGYGPEQGFCEPTDRVEVYDPLLDEWTEYPRMQRSRADHVSAQIDGFLVVAGGESQIPAICAIATDGGELGEAIVPVANVETLLVDDVDLGWQGDFKMERYRVRYAAVAWNGSMYTFGGQHAFQPDCLCFKTSNDIVVYESPPHVRDPTTPEDQSANGSDSSQGGNVTGDRPVVESVASISWCRAHWAASIVLILGWRFAL